MAKFSDRPESKGEYVTRILDELFTEMLLYKNRWVDGTEWVSYRGIQVQDLFYGLTERCKKETDLILNGVEDKRGHFYYSITDVEKEN